MKALLILCTLWHDMVQATVISNYCLQAQLLTSYVQFLRQKLLQSRTEPVKWMRVSTHCEIPLRVNCFMIFSRTLKISEKFFAILTKKCHLPFAFLHLSICLVPYQGFCGCCVTIWWIKKHIQ